MLLMIYYLVLPGIFLNSVTDLNSTWSQWKNIFIQVADASIPKIRWKKKKLKYWFSPLTIKLIRHKRKIYLQLLRQPSPALSDKYRKISDLVRSKTREDTRSYVESLSNLGSTNPKLFWRWINTSKKNRSIIPPVNHNGNVIYDDTAKARIFNDHFCSVFTNESDFEDVTELSKCLHHYPLLASSLTFTEEEVYNELKALNPLKACGPDGVPSLLLHKSAEHISFPLSILKFLGIRGNLLRWFHSFITCRFQRVVVGGQYSEWSPVALSSQGCPRDQSLGPYYLFFTWMISAVPSNIPPLSCLLMMLLSSRRLIM